MHKIGSPIAHLLPNNPPHFLKHHLEKTAKLAHQFAGSSGQEWAYIAGILHDLGKYNPEFQDYIHVVASISPQDSTNAHLEEDEDAVISSSNPKRKKGPDHSTAGAWWAMHRLSSCKETQKMGRALAYMIAGHHGGLSDWDNGLFDRLQRKGQDCFDKVKSYADAEILNIGISPTKDGNTTWD